MTLEAAKNSTRDWRWLTGLLVLCYVLLGIGLPALKVVSEKQLLQGLGVAALDHPLMDLRGVAAWCDAANEGKNPFVVPTWINLPGITKPHPNFLMNYSPVVLIFGHLGKLRLSAESVVWWGVGLALLYAIALWILSGSCSLPRALLWALFICSPTSVLAVERGNLDLLLFALLVLALLLRKQPYAEVFVILGASALKFFPIASLLILWKEKRSGGRAAAIIGGVIFLIFLAMLHSHLSAIGESLSGQDQTAFGCTTVDDLMVHYGILQGEGGDHLRIVLRLAAVIGLGGSLVAGYTCFRGMQENEMSEFSFHAFFLTVPIMMGLFVLGPQMDYKWIFFLFMVPAGLELANSCNAVKSLLSKSWLWAVGLYSYWTFFSDEGSFRNSLLKQCLIWIAMLLSAFLAGVLWSRKTTVS